MISRSVVLHVRGCAPFPWHRASYSSSYKIYPEVTGLASAAVVVVVMRQ